MRPWTAALILRLPFVFPPSRRAVDTVWRAWLDEHRSVWWSLLERRNRAAAGPDPEVRALSRLALGNEEVTLAADLLAGAAGRFDHPIGERARARLLALSDPEAVGLFCAAALDSPEAAAFCAAHHVAPADEVERAAFFVRTGQREQYRALDPEGTLLALGYRSAPSDVRRELLAAMTEMGDVDVLRVLAGQRSDRDDFASLSGPERSHLVKQLRDQHDWERLWPLVVLMPLPEAVDTARDAFICGWRPSGAYHRRLFETLQAVSPGAVAEWLRVDLGVDVGSADGLPSRRIPRTAIALSGLDERITYVHDLNFSPDGTQLAFAGLTRRQLGSDRGCAGIIGLGSNTLSRWYPDLPRPLGQVAHVGSDTLVVADAGEVGDMNLLKRVHRLAPDGIRSLGFEAPWIGALERLAGTRAFLVSAWHSDGGPRSTVSVGGADGAVADSGILDGLPIDLPLATTTDPEGRLIAVLDRRITVVADRTGSSVNVLDNGPDRASHGPLHAAMSDSVLVRVDSTRFLDIWHEPLGSTQTPVSRHVWPSTTRLIHLAWSPALNRFLAVGLRDFTQSSLWVLAVPETRDSPLPDDLVSAQVDLAGRSPHCARLSPKGDVLAVANWTSPEPTIDLYCLPLLALRQVLGQPMGLMSHQDLADVAAVLEHPALDEKSRQALGVLRACLEYRFRHDIGIGDPASVSGDAITLGRDGAV
ncbi:hypothetical protein [Streptomyces sp. GESEQ-35]|uniref:hypothetical protein n=1 Tax=Streptomyces sp. GESEQ-35 TaxID=2812657 RepID=UPI001B332DE8|nr:hypothetical protein [Streptomyces sp. GESEQ-35]